MLITLLPQSQTATLVFADHANAVVTSPTEAELMHCVVFVQTAPGELHFVFRV